MSCEKQQHIRRLQQVRRFNTCLAEEYLEYNPFNTTLALWSLVSFQDPGSDYLRLLVRTIGH